MKPTTTARYASRIERAVDLLTRRLDEGGDLPSNDALAEAAAMSPFHFQRVYRLMTGETPARTHQRLRLLRALREVARADASVTDAALAAGYSSSQALAKSLKNYRGATMTELKNEPGRLAAEIEQLAKPGGASRDDAATPLTIAVEDLEAFDVIALHNVGPYEDLANGYNRLFSVAAIAGRLQHLVGIYGIPYADRRFDPPATAHFDCCVALDCAIEVPPGLRLVQLGGGHYCRVRHRGAYAALETVTDAVYRAVLSAGELCDWSFADRPLFHHYLNDPEETAEQDLLTDVLVPLQRDGELK